jgi:hypothetical protein
VKFSSLGPKVALVARQIRALLGGLAHRALDGVDLGLDAFPRDLQLTLGGDIGIVRRGCEPAEGAEGLFDSSPQKFGTVVKSSKEPGRMPIARPTTAPAATMAGAATISTGSLFNSAMSRTQGRSGSGTSTAGMVGALGVIFGSGAIPGHVVSRVPW